MTPVNLVAGASVHQWDELVDEFGEYLTYNRQLAPLTVRNYTTDVAPFGDYLEKRGVDSFEDIDRLVIRGYLAWLLEIGYVKASVSRKLSSLRSFYAFMKERGLVQRDETDLVSAPKSASKLPPIANEGGIQALLEAPSATTDTGVRDRAILELAYACGLRLSEIAGLDVGDADLEQRQVRVTGKGSKDRVTVMGVPAAKAIRHHPPGSAVDRMHEDDLAKLKVLSRGLPLLASLWESFRDGPRKALSIAGGRAMLHPGAPSVRETANLVGEPLGCLAQTWGLDPPQMPD